MSNGISGTLSAPFSGRSNLSLPQRAFYLVAGLGLAAAGAKPRPNLLLNAVALAGGSYLAWSGYVGRCPAKAALLEQGGSGAGRIAERA